MKVVACLGNPGAEYSRTRHNVGWWLADRLAEAWGLGRLRQQGAAAGAEGVVDGVEVHLLKPLTYMNRSGAVLAPLRDWEGFDLARDLMVVVDDISLPPGRARFRPGGSAGGHNGLRSVEASLGTREYGRLRIGVGAPPPDVGLVDWVLSSPDPEERRVILDLLPALVDGAGVWLAGELDAAMERFNSIGRAEVDPAD